MSGYLSGRTSLTTVQTGDIAADAVTAAKIADDVVNSEHFAAASIDNEHLADDAVNAAEIGALTAALGDIMPTFSLIKLTPNVNGAPINCMEYKDVSVQISISCLALRPPTICEPEDSLISPAVLVAVGSHSVKLS